MIVIFTVVVIDSYRQSIYVLEQGGFSLFLDRDRILDPIGEPLVIAIAEHTIPPTWLRGIAYEVYTVSRNLIVVLQMEVVQYVGCFTDRVQETKIST